MLHVHVYYYICKNSNYLNYYWLKRIKYFIPWENDNNLISFPVAYNNINDFV